jgi:hypothetical protein
MVAVPVTAKSIIRVGDSYYSPSGVDWFWNWLGFGVSEPKTCSTIN